MVRYLVKFVVIILLVAGSFTEVFAQTERASAPLSGPRRQLAAILFTGLGGAILGLSTLSFYARPQDKLSNIAAGFAFGVITGTVFVTYRAATDPSVLYGLEPMHEMDEAGRGFGVQPQGGWARNSIEPQVPLKLSWSFEF